MQGRGEAGTRGGDWARREGVAGLGGGRLAPGRVGLYKGMLPRCPPEHVSGWLGELVCASMITVGP